MSVQPGTVLTQAIDELIAQLQTHENAANEIRATLKELRRRMASSGKRAGTKARSGAKRRKRAAEEDVPLPGLDPAPSVESSAQGDGAAN